MEGDDSCFGAQRNGHFVLLFCVHASEFDVSVGVLALLDRYLRHIGVDTADVFRHAGANIDLLSDPDGRVDIGVCAAIEDAAAELTGDECLGLHMGEIIEPSHYGIVGYLMMNSPTLAAAMTIAGRYHKLVSTALIPRTRPGMHGIRVTYLPANGAAPPSHHAYPSVIASMITLARKLTGREISPLEVGFCVDPPSSDAEYRRVFRCPVHFKCRSNYVVLNPAQGKTPTINPNEKLVAYFESYARRTLEKLEDSGGVQSEVARAATESFDGRGLGVRRIARQLNMSVRALQSRLAAEGTTFSAVVQHTRESAAKVHLRDGRAVEEIAFLLGYSDASAFIKAFKSWTGVTPREYRRSGTPAA